MKHISERTSLTPSRRPIVSGKSETLSGGLGPDFLEGGQTTPDPESFRSAPPIQSRPVLRPEGDRKHIREPTRLTRETPFGDLRTNFPEGGRTTLDPEPARPELDPESLLPELNPESLLSALDPESILSPPPIRSQPDVWAATDPTACPPSSSGGARHSTGRSDERSEGARGDPDAARPASKSGRPGTPPPVSPTPDASPQSEARTAWLRGRGLLDRKDFVQAELELRAAVNSDPQADYLAELGWALFVNPARREESQCEIRELLARALQLEPRTDRVFTVAGHFERWQQNVKKSENFFRLALCVNPQNREAAAQIRLFELRHRKSTWKWSELLRKPMRFFGRN